MGGSGPHEVFKALGPAEWGKDVVPDSGPDGIRAFMISTFAEAQCILDSIPVGTSTSSTTTGRPRASTDSSTTALPGRAPRTSEHARALRKDWKEIKVGPNENPLGINVYKMSGKDGKGAWFARRSLHEGLSFERWKLGMEREFAETMKLKKDPGSGNIRGIGAERCVENTTVDGCGKAKVYQLSAQFPGPTTPRDFVTLMLTSDSAIETPAQQPGHGQARYFMVVSKPCVHPECPQRSGYIRGYYESVEFIREIKINKPLRRTQSSIDTKAAEQPNLAAEAAKAALSKDAAGPDSSASRQIPPPADEDTMIEWLMVTRSDPGGSVPRFMVEKGTPSGICGDANKFLKWVSSKNLQDFDDDDGAAAADSDTAKLRDEAQAAEATATMEKKSSADPTSNVLDEPAVQPKPKLSEAVPALPPRPGSRASVTDEDPAPQGFYGVIANALGMVASHLPNPFGSAKGGDTDMSSLSAASSDISDADDSSSILSFHSVEGDEQKDDGDVAGASSDSTNLKRVETGASTGAAASINSADSGVAASIAGAAAAKSTSSATRNRSATQHEKDLRKLEDRRRKMEEKHARDLAKRAGVSTKDESAVAKLKEKHDRDKARQEEKYQRELRKLEARREAEERKAERRKQKALEKQEKSDLGMEMERVKAERDVALKQIEILKEQVGDLQSQNTLLVARLGREGITIDPAKLAAGAGPGIEGIFSDLSNGRRPAGGGTGSSSASSGSRKGGKGETVATSATAADPGVQVEGPACLMREQPVVKGEA